MELFRTLLLLLVSIEAHGSDKGKLCNCFGMVELLQRLCVCVCVCSSTSLLPVLEEEEEGIQESVVQVPTVEVDLAGRRK